VGWLHSLRGRLMLLLFAVGIIPVIIIGALSLFAQQRTYVELTGRLLTDTAQHAGQLLERHFRERYGDVNVQAQSPVVQSMNPAPLTKHLAHVVQSYRPANSLIVVADAAGKLVAANTIDGAGQPVPLDRLSGMSMDWSRAAVVEDLHEDPVLRAL